MKISYRWLQTYFKDPLPTPTEVAEILSFHIFEVEEIIPTKNDTVLDVKVLPDRACYCLSHRGVAEELSALIKNKFIDRKIELGESRDNAEKINVEVEDLDFCDRYVSVQILNISKKESPKYLVEFLEAVDQKSINFIVDLSNFVMLDLGQPMHAFDGEKVAGKISVRKAVKGEKMTTLDGKEVVFDGEECVIADLEGVLAIAGIKGGKKAEVTKFTNHVILEAAHFDPASVRKNSSKIGIKNESSKRFENSVNVNLPPLAINYFLNLMQKEDPQIVIGEISDINLNNDSAKELSFSPEFIGEYIGIPLSYEKIIEILGKINILGQKVNENILVRVPSYRKDINIKEDIADEIVRIIGYENLKGELPELPLLREENHEISGSNMIKNFLTEKGYSEVYTYALKDKGEVEILNPLATDKAFMRANLTESIAEKLVSNKYFADLLGLKKVKIFEIGKVWSGDGEKTSLCIGVAFKNTSKNQGESQRPNDEIKILRDELLAFIGPDFQTLCTIDDTGGLIVHKNKQIGTINNADGILEIDFDYLLSVLLVQEKEALLDYEVKNVTYKPVSIYPFITRDIAVFLPGELTEENGGKLVLGVIHKFAGDLLVRVDLFDIFVKINKETNEKNTSFGYRLVFQSYIETLEDEKINRIMERITDEMNRIEGWKVR